MISNRRHGINMATPRICVQPFLNDFLYDILYHASTEQKRKLPKRYAKKLRDGATTRRLVEHTYFEEKMDILQGLGYTWFLVFHEDTRTDFRNLKEVFEKYRAEEGKTTLQSVVEKKMYVSSDRKFCYQLGLMADSANSPNYSQSLLLNKAGYHIQKWKKQMKGPITDTAREHMEITKYLMEMLLNMALELEYIDDFLGITRNDIKILSYLYIKQNIFVDYGQIVQRFSNNLSLTKITGCLRRLCQKGMVNKTPKANEKRYQISAYGLMSVATFYKNVLKANEF